MANCITNISSPPPAVAPSVTDRQKCLEFRTWEAEALYPWLLGAFPKVCDALTVSNKIIDTTKFKGNFVHGTNYNLGESVVSGGKLYIALAPTNAVPPSEDWYEYGKYVIDQNVTYQVGAGGDFLTLNGAIEAVVQKHAQGYKQEGIRVVLNLVSGFVLQEQVIAKDIDLSYITITGTDTQTVVEPATFSSAIAGTLPIFVADNAKLPVLNQIFTMSATGRTSSHVGMYIVSNSSAVIGAGAGVKDTGGTGVICSDNSHLVANGAIISGCLGNGMATINNSSIVANGISIQNVSQNGVYAGHLSSVTAQNANINGCGGHGAYMERQSYASIDGASVMATAYAIYVANLSTVVAVSSVLGTSRSNFHITAVVNGGRLNAIGFSTHASNASGTLGNIPSNSQSARGDLILS